MCACRLLLYSCVQAAVACNSVGQGGVGQQCSRSPQLQTEQLVQLVSDGIDLQLLRQLAATAAVPQPQSPLPPAARTFRVSMGVACDEAFFRYFQQ